jgi:hypothetical protein
MERSVLTEQRTNIKFFVKLCKSGWEILKILATVYGESDMKRRTVKSGSVVVRFAAKKPARVVQKSRSCSLLFFFVIFEEWSITDLFHRVTQLMPHFM